VRTYKTSRFVSFMRLFDAAANASKPDPITDAVRATP
jgi:hypothetical protein